LLNFLVISIRFSLVIVLIILVSSCYNGRTQYSPRTLHLAVSLLLFSYYSWYVTNIVNCYELYIARLYVMILILRVGYKNNSCIRETQENSIRNSLQNSLPYILLQMVYGNYCAPYPKWLCVKHEANMWSPCCMMLSCFRTFYDFLLSPIINIVTTSSDVTDVINHF